VLLGLARAALLRLTSAVLPALAAAVLLALAASAVVLGLAAAVLLGLTCAALLGLAPAVLLARIAGISHSCAPASLSLLGKRTTEEIGVRVHVGVEARETHEQEKDRRTREREWEMVAKKAPTQVASGARLLRRSGGHLSECAAAAWKEAGSELERGCE
jgi:hypothetical protein